MSLPTPQKNTKKPKDTDHFEVKFEVRFWFVHMLEQRKGSVLILQRSVNQICTTQNTPEERHCLYLGREWAASF